MKDTMDHYLELVKLNWYQILIVPVLTKKKHIETIVSKKSDEMKWYWFIVCF